MAEGAHEGKSAQGPLKSQYWHESRDESSDEDKFKRQLEDEN